MKFDNKYIIIISCLFFLIAGFQVVDAQEDIAQQAYAIFQQHCLECHGESGAYKDSLLIDRAALIETQVVLPGDPENSEFYKRLLGSTEKGPQMPLNLPPLSQDAIETVARWITEGAPDWDVQRDINFITTDTILGTIQTHLESLDSFDRPSARYFTLTHLYNAGESPQTLSDYRIALSKLINSLSWKLEVTNPTSIDTAKTIFYIDLRHYEWSTRTDVWALIEQAYPYNIDFDPATQAGLLEKLTQLQTETGSTVPYIYVDWFLATASLPPLYHDILNLPQTDRELETQLAVNVENNIRNAPGINVWRAGFNDSGVSTNNRVVERHASRDGAYWKSYDFAGSTDSQNIFTHPLDFTHDGGEIIFNLPNGLQAYFLVDANGTRLNEAPIDIVSNPAASDPTVRNGLSCIGCHDQGMKKFADSVRAAIERDQNPPYNREHALRLYPKQSKLNELLQKDTQRFQQALEKIGGPFTDDESRQQFFKRHENEPVQRFHEVFQGPLDASHAAAAIGLETAVFLTQISEKQSLKNLGLQTLIDENGTVKRDAWTSNFHDVISALNTPDSDLPPVVERPDRIPGAGVFIPDVNLRAAIEEALGKAADEVITVEDMAWLTHLDVQNYDEPRKENISNLTGLEFAINLSFLHIGGNSISDLSPLAGLTKLDFLDAQDNLISNISPLKGLTNLRGLILTGNLISNLLPLEGLTNLEALRVNRNLINDFSPITNLTTLKEIWIANSSISDLSQFTGLINLEGIHVWDAPIEDLSPLTGLTKLKWLNFGRTQVSDLVPLAHLTNLRKLTFYDCQIDDLSHLEGLTELVHIKMPHNMISDISSLEGAINLTYLEVGNNTISDISALEKLTNLETLWIDNNNISDVSSLAELTNLQELNLRGNPITDFSPLAGLFENTNVVFDVAIPDPNLRVVIVEALEKEDATTPITLQDMMTLTKLEASGKGIQDLTGLEFAIDLQELRIRNNQIADISPLKNLIKLRDLAMGDNLISDLSPLKGMKNLMYLSLFNNPVSDLSPLEQLSELRYLTLANHSNIDLGVVDLSPLAGLNNLTSLHFNNVKVVDLKPLAGLVNLEGIGFSSNGVSDMSPLAGLVNLKGIHTWGNPISDISFLINLTKLEEVDICGAENISDLSPLEGKTELKGLYLVSCGISNVSGLEGLTGLTELDLRSNNISDISPLAKLTSLKWLNLTHNAISDFSPLEALARSTVISRAFNPAGPIAGTKIEGPWLWVTVPKENVENNTDFLSVASDGAVTEQHIATKGAKEGNSVGDNVWISSRISSKAGTHGNIGHMLISHNMETHRRKGVIYGVVILGSQQETNTTMFAGSSAPLKVWLNGELVHEANAWRIGKDYQDFFPVTLKRGANVLLVSVHMGNSELDAYIGFEEDTEYAVILPGTDFTFSATETTLLSGDTFTLNLNAENITDLAGWQTDIVFDPNVLETVEVTEGDFLKNDSVTTFFQGGTIDNTTGKITDLFSARIAESGVSGTGTLLSVTFKAKASGETEVTLENFEFSSITGDIIPAVPPNITITVGEYPAWDVNQDGRVSIQDLVLVARDLGAGSPANLRADVNRDGVVNVQDLILVQQHMGESTTPAAPAIDIDKLTPALVQTWIKQAQLENDGSIVFQQGIENLQKLLASLLPEKNALLANYPNPFNPETWIPYHLSKSADVTLTIYTSNGIVVRTLALGHQTAGIYQNRSRAAYWDGKNSVGELVASGIYFYTLTAGDFTATRKMLIRK